MPFNKKIQDTPLDEAVGHEITRIATNIARKLTTLECHMHGTVIKNPQGPGYAPKAAIIFNRHLNQTIDELYGMVNEIDDIKKEIV